MYIAVVIAIYYIILLYLTSALMGHYNVYQHTKILTYAFTSTATLLDS